jgi:hypothetical protein
MFLLSVRRRQFGSGVDFGVGGRIKSRHFLSKMIEDILARSEFSFSANLSQWPSLQSTN